MDKEITEDVLKVQGSHDGEWMTYDEYKPSDIRRAEMDMGRLNPTSGRVRLIRVVTTEEVLKDTTPTGEENE